jgi:hypothetical protein
MGRIVRTSMIFCGFYQDLHHLLFLYWDDTGFLLLFMYKMVHWCLFWCLWRGMNDRNFEDQERTLEEIKSLFFKTLNIWTAAYVFPVTLSYNDFLVLFCFF